MCYDLHHRCQYCNSDYLCSLDNNICPSINYDSDQLMCDNCRNRINKLAEVVTYDEIRKKYVLIDE